jgi:hypothetical protein
MSRDTFGLSGLECAAALQRLGLELVRCEDECSVLRRGRRIVVVPHAVALPAAILHEIISRADVSLDAMLRGLDDIPTEPDLRFLVP